MRETEAKQGRARAAGLAILLVPLGPGLIAQTPSVGELLERGASRLERIESRLGVPKGREEPVDVATLERVLHRLERIEELLEPRAEQEIQEAVEVVLEEESVAPDALTHGRHPLARPWFENLHLSGFLAFRVLGGGDAGPLDDWGFYLDQLHVDLEAVAWEDASVYLEIIAARPGGRNDVRVGEAYARFDRLFGIEGLGVKLGRFDLPFGEEYVRRRAPENPLIFHAAAVPYGWDEGVQVFGERGGVHFAAALTDGEYDFSGDSGDDKAQTVKVWGSPLSWLDASASFHRTGDTRSSGFCFGRTTITPVGANRSSTLGASPSESVNTLLYELDLRVRPHEDLALETTFGQAFLNDAADAFDRELFWFRALLLWDLRQDLKAALSWSEFGSANEGEGYVLNGGRLGGGAGAFGFDAEHLRRISLGLNWRLDARTILKAEAGWDDFDLVPGSPVASGDGSRWFTGIELTLLF